MSTPKKPAAALPDLQISTNIDGFLVRGDIDALAPGLKAFAVRDDKAGAWTVTKRRAAEYEHQYGLRLVGAAKKA
jgi:hypothetical protein